MSTLLALLAVTSPHGRVPPAEGTPLSGISTRLQFGSSPVLDSDGVPIHFKLERAPMKTTGASGPATPRGLVALRSPAPWCLLSSVNSSYRAGRVYRDRGDRAISTCWLAPWNTHNGWGWARWIPCGCEAQGLGPTSTATSTGALEGAWMGSRAAGTPYGGCWRISWPHYHASLYSLLHLPASCVCLPWFAMSSLRWVGRAAREGNPSPPP